MNNSSGCSLFVPHPPPSAFSFLSVPMLRPSVRSDPGDGEKRVPWGLSSGSSGRRSLTRARRSSQWPQYGGRGNSGTKEAAGPGGDADAWEDFSKEEPVDFGRLGQRGTEGAGNAGPGPRKCKAE